MMVRFLSVALVLSRALAGDGNTGGAAQALSDSASIPTVFGIVVGAGVPQQGKRETNTMVSLDSSPMPIDYVLAAQRASCTQACRKHTVAKGKEFVCDEAEVLRLASDIDNCKAVINNNLPNDKGGFGRKCGGVGVYPDSNLGCVYMPDQSGWCQIMWKTGPPTPPCSFSDSSDKGRVCPCKPKRPAVLYKISIRMLSGESFELDVSSNDDAQTLMQHIEQAQGIPWYQQSLMLEGGGGGFMDTPAMTLAEYGATAGATVQLIINWEAANPNATAPAAARCARCGGVCVVM